MMEGRWFKSTQADFIIISMSSIMEMHSIANRRMKVQFLSHAYSIFLYKGYDGKVDMLDSKFNA